MKNYNEKIHKRNYFYKVVVNEIVIDKCQTHSLRRFRNKIGTINRKDLIINRGEVYLKVSYGKYLDNFGKRTTFHNEGVYQNKKSFYLALKAFLEK